MATKSELRPASGLQMFSVMKRLAVAILAMTCVGCGVGADEYYDGDTLVTSSATALTGEDSTVAPETATTASTQTGTQPPATAKNSGLPDPGIVGLPQDPIPVRPNENVGIDPSMGGRFGGVPGMPAGPR